MTKQDQQPQEPTGRDVAGITIQYLVNYLQTAAPEGTLARALELAGETRTVAELTDPNTWSAYLQYRRLLEAAGQVLGGPGALVAVGMHVFDSIQSPEMSEAMNALGSPAAVYAILPGLSTMPAVELETESIDPTQCRVRFRFKSGFEPFPEHCFLTLGLFASIPRNFGHEDAHLHFESCQSNGSAWCQARLSWDVADDESARISRAELQARVAQARLEELQRTVAELVSGDDLRTVLGKVVEAANRAVLANSMALVSAVTEFPI